MVRGSHARRTVLVRARGRGEMADWTMDADRAFWPQVCTVGGGRGRGSGRGTGAEAAVTIREALVNPDRGWGLCC